MRYPKRLLLLLIYLMPLFAIGGETEKTVTPTELREMCNLDPLDNCAYLGTSDGYHYFRRVHGKTSRNYKVAESLLKLKTIFPPTKGEPYLVTREMIDSGTTVKP